MSHITSAENPRLKSLRRLQQRRERERSGRFMAEGEDLLAAAARAGREPLEGFRVAGSGLGGPGFHDVAPAALRAVSMLGSGTRVIGVFAQRWEAPRGPLCVYLHGVRDPGNVGTVLRSAHAFGAACVALGPGCADPHSPKAVRASMGAIFAVALARVTDPAQLPGRRIALAADAPEPLRGDAHGARGDAHGGHGGAQVGRGDAHGEGDDPHGGREGAVSLLVGAEREGLAPEVLAACERTARIPIASDSLNAAMAATVALYEITRDAALAPSSSRVRSA